MGVGLRRGLAPPRKNRKLHFSKKQINKRSNHTLLPQTAEHC